MHGATIKIMNNFILSLFFKHNGTSSTKIEPKYAFIDFMIIQPLLVPIFFGAIAT
jgi:hypothetical protein